MENKVQIFERAWNWIRNNTIENKGIAVTSRRQLIYPEVTGYYIPSLLIWGERDLAVSYAKYLCGIQKQDGSWYDSEDKEPYVFDSAQILKGLISIREILPEVDECIIRGCDWILTNVQKDGRLITPSKDAWGNDDNFCSELIHIYCLTPLKDAGQIFNRKDYIEAVDKILAYYKRNRKEQILNFSLLSHFYAYVMEGLLDLGETDLVKEAMHNIESYQNLKGGIPGLRDVAWVCSTGMFQLALVWYKLGELEKGNRFFEYTCSLQNKSGGWFGSYPVSKWKTLLGSNKQRPYYFPNEEISWANKYFLDALAYKEKLEFEKQAPVFQEKIDDKDGRYVLIKNMIEMIDRGARICDIGCGKGRYLKRLSTEYSENEYYAMDLSANVMKNIDCAKEKKTGRLTQIPYKDNYFDMVYVCEALEHAINIEGALKELYRIVKPDGKAVIIDKPAEKLGQIEIDEWEQWIDDKIVQRIIQHCGGSVEIIESVSYEEQNDGLFRAWIISK